jgi:hypothetical protein
LPLFGDPGPEALDDYIGSGGEFVGCGTILWLFQVQGDRAFPAVKQVLRRRPGERPGVSGAVDADHVGAVLGQRHGGERAGSDSAEFDYPQVGEGTAREILLDRCPHAVSPCCGRCIRWSLI